MKYNKAGFRATRERLGLTQQNIADMAEVTVLSVKKWEKLSGNNIPADVQDLMRSLEDNFDEGVEATLSALAGIVENQGGNPETVEITYFRSQEDYNRAGRDDGPFGYVNAMSRAVASRLTDMGIPVRFIYPEEKAAEY